MAGGKKKRMPAVGQVGTRAKKGSKAQKPQKPQKAQKPSKASKEERRLHKLTQRKERKAITFADWNAPVPSHLIAKLDNPRIKSKYQSYFEFAENSEKQDKKLDYQVTDKITPHPGYGFVPIGDPRLTSKCKELSREQGAMIFIVSNKGKEESLKISEHIYRIGYHFRETIIEEAQDWIGETVISKPSTAPGFIEPIPESQEEINKQADGAIRDLFPRIPNTDRQMIIEHAFKKGGMFHGEPTVGLQSEIPLSRRVQLAVLAHIRHTHTRYDKLLRETSWINARKAVEPVCLDVLIKWRGDEETGRDQLDEILREVVIITDSEGEDDDSSEEEDTSDEEGEVTSESSSEPPSNSVSRNEQREVIATKSLPLIQQQGSNTIVQLETDTAISGRTRSKATPHQEHEKKKQRGFSRYQAAYDDAMQRKERYYVRSSPIPHSGPSTHPRIDSNLANVVPGQNMSAFANSQSINYATHPNHNRQEQSRYAPPPGVMRTEPHYTQLRPVQSSMRREEVTMRAEPDRLMYNSFTQPRAGTPYAMRERSPQVVRGSPVRHNPQDMPLPSIETAQLVASPTVNRHDDMHSSFRRPQESYARRADEQHMHSPTQRQVIILDDDSPQAPKRRRIVREDNAGHFRVDPVSSHRQDFYVVPSSSIDSHPISTSSVEYGNFFGRHSRAQPQATQGLSRSRQRIYIDPVTAEELPIFDERPVGHLARHSDVPRIRSDEYASETRAGHNAQHVPPFYTNDAQRAIQHQRALPSELGHEAYHVVQEPSHRHDVRQTRELVQSFSQSHLDPPNQRSNNDFIVLSDRGQQQSHGAQSTPVRYYEGRRGNAIQQPVLARTKTPIRYIERSDGHVGEVRVPAAYHNDQRAHARNEFAPHSHHQHQQQFPPGPPTYARSDPRRQVIVLE